jgi:P-type Ca2+ transporter type 2C
MAVQVEAAGQPTAADRPWYARSPDEVTAALHVDPPVGLTAARAGELLSATEPRPRSRPSRWSWAMSS